MERQPGAGGIRTCPSRESAGTAFSDPATVRMILSGYTDVDAVADTINVGAVYKFLDKPWHANGLCSIIDEAFEKYEDDLRRFCGGKKRYTAAR